MATRANTLKGVAASKEDEEITNTTNQNMFATASSEDKEHGKSDNMPEHTSR